MLRQIKEVGSIESENNYTPPAPRLTETWLTQKIRPSSAIISWIVLAFILIVSRANWDNYLGISQFLAAIPSKVFSDKEYWRVFSAVLIHADLQHFLSNGAALIVLGYLLYGWFGFLIYPLGAWLLAGLVNFLALLTYSPEVQLVGASGMVYLMAAFWLTNYVLIQRQITLTRRILRSSGVTLVTLFPTTFQPNVSYRTHAIGFVVGVVWAILWNATSKQKLRKTEIYKFESY